MRPHMRPEVDRRLPHELVVSMVHDGRSRHSEGDDRKEGNRNEDRGFVGIVTEAVEEIPSVR
jgi:hypothetical protein